MTQRGRYYVRPVTDRGAWWCYAVGCRWSKRARTRRARATAALAALALIVAPAMVHAAVWARLTFTTPGDAGSGVGAYVAQDSYDGEVWQPLHLYRTQGDTSAVVAKAAGALDTLFASVSEATWIWLAGGTRVRLAAVDRAGNRGPWTLFVVAAGPDTEWTPVRGVGARPGFEASRRIGRLPYFVPAVGDTAAVWLEHEEVTQARVRARLCQLYGYACRRGVRDTAWCTSP